MLPLYALAESFMFTTVNSSGSMMSVCTLTIEADLVTMTRTLMLDSDIVESKEICKTHVASIDVMDDGYVFLLDKDHEPVCGLYSDGTISGNRILAPTKEAEKFAVYKGESDGFCNELKRLKAHFGKSSSLGPKNSGSVISSQAFSRFDIVEFCGAPFGCKPVVGGFTKKNIIASAERVYNATPVALKIGTGGTLGWQWGDSGACKVKGYPVNYILTYPIDRSPSKPDSRVYYAIQISYKTKQDESTLKTTLKQAFKNAGWKVSVVSGSLIKVYKGRNSISISFGEKGQGDLKNYMTCYMAGNIE